MNMSRKQRIAKGSGRSITEVNRLVKQFEQMQKTMKQLRGMSRHGGLMGKMPFGRGGFGF